MVFSLSELSDQGWAEREVRQGFGDTSHGSPNSEGVFPWQIQCQEHLPGKRMPSVEQLWKAWWDGSKMQGREGYLLVRKMSVVNDRVDNHFL